MTIGPAARASVSSSMAAEIAISVCLRSSCGRNGCPLVAIAP